MLPTYAIVLLVNADSILLDHRTPIPIADEPVKIGNATQTVTAKLQVVTYHSGTDISQIESHLSMVRWSRISIWNAHLTQADAVKERPVVIPDVPQDQSLAVVEADAHLPLLPRQDTILGDLEARAIWLNNVQRLKVSPQLDLTRNVLVGGFLFVCSLFKDVVVGPGGDVLDFDKLHVGGIEYRRESQGPCVMVTVELSFLTYEHVNLEVAVKIINSIGTENPRLWDDFQVVRQLQLVNLCLDFSTFHDRLFNLQHFAKIHISVNSIALLLGHSCLTRREIHLSS